MPTSLGVLAHLILPTALAGAGIFAACGKKQNGVKTTTIAPTTQKKPSTAKQPPGGKGSLISLMATIEGLPDTVSSATSLNLTVAGAGVDVYSFALLDGSGIPCARAEGLWSPWTSVQKLLRVPLGSDGVKTLCLKAKGSKGESAPVGHSWRKDTLPPAVSLRGAPTARVPAAGFALSVESEDAVSYRTLLLDSSGETAQSCAGKLTDALASFVPVTRPLVINSVVAAERTLCLEARDGAGNVSQPLVLTWRQGNRPPLATPRLAIRTEGGIPTVRAEAECRVEGARDDDGDALTIVHAWTVNGAAVPAAFDERLALSAFRKGDVLGCIVTVRDDFGGASQLPASPIALVNAAPGPVSDVSIRSSDMTCVAGGAIDPDVGDMLAYEFTWRRNGLPFIDWNGSPLLAGALFPGDRVECGARAKDSAGLVSPAVVWSDAFTLTNSSPGAPTAVAIAAGAIGVSDTLSCSATPGTDVDSGDTVTLEYRWSIDGALVSGQSTSTFAASLAGKNKTVACEAASSDGALRSAWVPSPGRLIDDTPPSVPASAAISPASPSVASTLTCGHSTSTDADGDAVTYVYEWSVAGGVVSGASSSTLTAPAFAKGQSVSCRVKSVAAGAESAFSAASTAAVIQNTAPPAAASVSLSPATATRADTLTCSHASGGADPDGDSVSPAYFWYRNGTLIDGASGSTLSLSSYAKGSGIECRVQLGDGTGLSSAAASSVVTILNSVPGAPSGVGLSPATAKVSDTLSCSATPGTDVDSGDTVTLEYRWSVDGSVVAGQSSSTFAASLAGKTKTVTCEAASSDGALRSVWESSPGRLIDDTPPSVPASAVISPTSPSVASTLTCGHSTATDADGDAVTYVYEWSVAGGVVSGASSSTLAAPAFAKGQSVTCRVKSVAAGAESAFSAASTAAVIQNAAPPAAASVSLSPMTVTRADTLTCSPVSGGSDPDGDSVSPAYFWYRNGTLISGASGSTLSLASYAKGSGIECRVQMGDGTGLSSAVASSVVTILNSAPGAPSGTPTLAPTSATAATTTFTCSGGGTSVDLDSDTLSYEWAWMVDGETVVDWSSSTSLDNSAPGQVFKGDVLSCGKRALETTAGLTSEPKWSTPITIANEAPDAPGAVTIFPDPAYSTSTLTCQSESSFDLDGDGVTLEYRWSVAGTVVVGQTASTLSPAHFALGNEVICSVRGNDGFATSSFTASGTRTILTPPPVALTATNPPSHTSTAKTILVQGTSALAGTVYVYLNGTCSGSAVASGSAADLQGAGLPVALDGEDVYVPISANTEESPGVFSSCSQTLYYARAPVRLASFVSSPADLRTFSSQPRALAASGTSLYFAAIDSRYGFELFKSDGTSAGTSLLKNVNPGGDSSPSFLTPRAGGGVWFYADDGVNGFELWVSDGTAAGTYMPKSVATGAKWSLTSSIVDLDGIAIFDADGGGNMEPWRSDGTEAGTYRLRDIRVGSSGSYPRNFVRLGSIVLFSATGAEGRELWKTDGTVAGTVLVKDINPGAPNSDPDNLTVAGGIAFFNATDASGGWELWRTDGSTAGTYRVKDINPGVAGGVALGGAIGAGIGEVYFPANDGVRGMELWKSNGTEEGTVLVADIVPGATGSNPNWIYVMGPRVYFQATEAATGAELYVSDGTAAGTSLLKDIRSGTSSSSPQYFRYAGARLVFMAATSSTGTEMWTTDGTTAGTFEIKDIYSGGTSGVSNSVRSVEFGGEVFFQANDNVTGQELWKTDGTQTGTILVKDIHTGPSSSNPGTFWGLGGGAGLLFSASDSATGGELWTTDGTAVGTILLKDVRSGAAGSSIANAEVIGSKLYFGAADGSNGQEPWVSDGTSAGTFLLKNIRSGSSGSDPIEFREAGGWVYFSASDSLAGRELWRTDGTTANTTMVANIHPTGDSSPGKFTAFNGALYFSANDGTNGTELWKTDGTAAGTVMVADLNPGSASSSPSSLRVLGTRLLFSANVPATGAELYSLDSVSGAITLVRDIRSGTSGSSIADSLVIGAVMYFVGDDGSTGKELWKSDGTTAGTVRVRDIYSGSSASLPRDLSAFNGKLLFTADSAGSGREVWVSDGSSAGTVLVADVRPGGIGSSPSNFFVGNKRAFFRAQSGTGMDLWTTDGTAAGTYRIYDFDNEAGLSATPLIYNGRLYFGGLAGHVHNSLFGQ